MFFGSGLADEPSPWCDGDELSRGVDVPGAALRQVSLLVGDTALELLEYRSPPSGTDQARYRCDDLGASHVASSVDDIESNKAALEAKEIDKRTDQQGG